MGEESNRTSIKEMFQSMVPQGVELMQGTVIRASPLQIQIANDGKLVIGEAITVVPKHLTDYEVEVDMEMESSGGGNSGGNDTQNNSSNVGGTVSVHNALKDGDRVHILALQNGKKYVVLGRV